MGEGSFGLVEIGLAFGLVLAAAVAELLRNRRALQRLRRSEKKSADRAETT